jgi:hypothetical protein
VPLIDFDKRQVHLFIQTLCLCGTLFDLLNKGRSERQPTTQGSGKAGSSDRLISSKSSSQSMRPGSVPRSMSLHPESANISCLMGTLFNWLNTNRQPQRLVSGQSSIASLNSGPVSRSLSQPSLPSPAHVRPSPSTIARYPIELQSNILTLTARSA